MNGIIKRRKKVDYAQIHNTPLQQLEDIRSIGLIAHLMSLPENWEIKKMQLYNKFGRGPITNAIKELESKRYWVDIKYRDGKKNFHYYNASDVPFTDEEVLEFIEEVKESGYKVLEISEKFKHLISSVENQQLKKDENFSSVGFQQLNINCSFSTVENQHLLNKDNKKEINKKEINKNIVNNIVNKEYKSKDEIILELTNEYRSKGLSKDVCLRVVDEVNLTPDIHNYGAYLRTCLENTLYKSQLKRGSINISDDIKERLQDSSIPYYDWLNN